MASAPVLVTPRLTLRAHRPGDLDDLHAMWGDAEVVRYIGGGQPQSREDCWARLLRYAGMWKLTGMGFWAVTRTGEDRLIGDVGVMESKREIDPPLEAPETGWGLRADAHGQGFATEAMAAVLAWADEAAGPRTQCVIDPGNVASMRMAEKLGYRLLGERSYRGSATGVWERMGYG